MTITDHRGAAHDRVKSLIQLLASRQEGADLSPVIAECESLANAISAFHMEGIRFRMFNVDRLLSRSDLQIPDEVRQTFAQVRQDLEAAGFHTRSHQAPS
jgi:hypothetical protein